MSLVQKIAHNTLLQIAGKAVSAILGLWGIAIITRYLGPAGFGEYTTIITFLTFFAVTADFGLTLVTAQMIGADETRENKILNNLFSFRLLSATALLIIAPLVVLIFPYSAEIKFGVLITTAAFIFPALNQVLIGLFQKKLSMGRDAIAEVISRVVLVIALLIGKEMNLGLNGALAATVASAATSFFLHYFLSLKFVSIKWEFDREVWGKIITKSWPLAITIFFNLIYLRADILLLSIFQRPEAVGLYGATYRIIDVLTTVPFMFAGLILPILAGAWIKKNQEYFKNILQKSFDVMAALAIPLAIGAQWFSGPIMLYTGGQDFAAAGPILQILILGVAAIFPGTVLAHAVIALDQQKKMIKFYVFTSLSSLAAYFILIPRFSYYGAAAITIYSEILIAIFSGYVVFKLINFRPSLKTSGKAVIGGIIMATFLFLFGPQNNSGPLYVGTSFVIASLIYLGSFILLGGVKTSDWSQIIPEKTAPRAGGGPSYPASGL